MPQHKRGPWSQQEDQHLLHLVTVHGANNWVRISTAIQTRSPKQCRERYHQNLKPNLNHDPITPDEGILIEQMVGEMGKRWAEIARRLRGRSDNAVKNWWNGGMNRRRRSNQQRRTEFEVRQQNHHGQHQQMQAMPQPMPQQPLPPAFQQHHMMPQMYMAHAMLPAHMHHHGPQQISVPNNMAVFGRMMETPLPSPSAFSQLSHEGPPSLISDCSSMSTRSPHQGPCPIELPPLAGGRENHRRSSAPMLRLGVPNSYVQDSDFAALSGMHMQQIYDDTRKHQQQQGPMLQEPFMPQPHQQQQQQQQSLPTPTAYLPSQPRQPSPLHQQHQIPHAFAVPIHQVQRRHSAYPMPSTPGNAHIPIVSKHDSNEKPHIIIDSGLATPILSAPTPDDSPKDKMSLSNLTH